MQPYQEARRGTSSVVICTEKNCCFVSPASQVIRSDGQLYCAEPAVPGTQETWMLTAPNDPPFDVREMAKEICRKEHKGKIGE